MSLLAVATVLGRVGASARRWSGMALAWAYSAPPLRLKAERLAGEHLACGACYEGLPWFTGAAVHGGGSGPIGRMVVVAALYSLGAHGIMTLNDFKSVEGDLADGDRLVAG